MDKKKEYGNIISGLLENPQYRVSIIEGLNELGNEIYEEMKYSDDYKSRALNMLYIDAYKTFQSFILLMENRHISSSVLLLRKIIEIFIRIEYISISSRYEDYCRSKSNDQAKILSSILNSRPIKYVSQTVLWKKRHQIIVECKQIFEDMKNGRYKQMPNLDKMAEDTGLYVLYIEKYSPLSKFVHSNISVENFYLYQDKEGINYSNGSDEVTNHEGTVKTYLNDTMYCFYRITQRYIKEMKVKEDKLKKFDEEFFIFVSFDLITGNTKSNVDITKNIVRSLTGKELPADPEDEKHEVLFLEDDLNTLRKDWTKLESLVKQKENELKVIKK